MKILITQIKKPYDDPRSPEEILIKSLNVDKSALSGIQIVRESLDARHKNKPVYIYNFSATVNNESLLAHPNVDILEEQVSLIHESPVLKLDSKPVIIGSGPAGLFAGLGLAKKGYKPWILERGQNVHERALLLKKFLSTRKLDIHSNVAFGEGGAGTFSDGKLTTRSKSHLTQEVIEILIEHGAPEAIRYQARPHLGTDKIRKIIMNIRETIKQNGGQISFNSFIDDIEIRDGEITAISINGQNQKIENLILACGSSANEIYDILKCNSVLLEPKPFAIGVRVEHPQQFINNIQYGPHVKMEFLGAAEYILTYKNRCFNKGTYSFCMCPGGKIICASSHRDRLVLNGMSYSRRNLSEANSAIVVTVDQTDFGTTSPLAGLNFRDKIEQLAFRIAPQPYQAPAQHIRNFIENKDNSKSVETSYQLGTFPMNLNHVFPSIIKEALKEALIYFDGQIKGFIDKGIMLAPETRTSAPVRILRDANSFCSVNTKGLYPIGEGSGYAGGIISSAVDALRFVSKVKPFL